jgi:hypothetical protein
MYVAPLEGRNLPAAIPESIKKAAFCTVLCLVLPVTMLCDDVGRPACIKYGDCTV